jgi:hypothetical protein
MLGVALTLSRAVVPRRPPLARTFRPVVLVPSWPAPGVQPLEGGRPPVPPVARRGLIVLTAKAEPGDTKRRVEESDCPTRWATSAIDGRGDGRRERWRGSRYLAPVESSLMGLLPHPDRQSRWRSASRSGGSAPPEPPPVFLRVPAARANGNSNGGTERRATTAVAVTSAVAPPLTAYACVDDKQGPTIIRTTISASARPQARITSYNATAIAEEAPAPIRPAGSRQPTSER